MPDNRQKTRPSMNLPPTQGGGKASELHEALVQLANPKKAVDYQRFFKTGPGEYGEGDRFLGISVPVTRRVARLFETLPLSELTRNLKSPWHEERLCALVILTKRFAKADDPQAIVEFYLAHTKYINNWDLVDVSCARILGAYYYPKGGRHLKELARSESLWEQRMAIVATGWFIREGSFALTLAISRMFLNHSHDLIHKATGWMLREVGKKNINALKAFLDVNAARMPRTMLRYAIEKLPETQRRTYLHAKSKLGH